MQKLIIVANVLPESKSSAAGARMMQLIELFLKNKWSVTFAALASSNDLGDNIEILGVKTVNIRVNDPAFDEFIRSEQPDVVLFDRFYVEEQFGWRVAAQCPDAVRILDTEDLHFLRWARQEAVKHGKTVGEANLYSEMAKREIGSILRSDLTLIISDFEMELLQQSYHVPVSKLFYLPILISSENLQKTRQNKKFEEKKDFVFIGNFLHTPNWDCVLHLKQEIWKKIRLKLPDAVLHIYGAYPTQKAFDLQDKKSGFLVHGRAENALECLAAARICLAPLRFGAGIKGKLLEAMLVGTPSVTTSIGAEGMHLHGTWNGIIADDTDEFANAAVELYEQQKEWTSAQQKGYEILEKKFSNHLFETTFRERITNLVRDLEQERKKEFIGSIMMHHRMMGTKYLSKWIEAKNKV